MRIQFWHVVVLLLVILLLFGANRLPDLARSVGRSLKILKEEVTDLRGDAPAAGGPATPGPPDAGTGEPPTSTSAGEEPGGGGR